MPGYSEQREDFKWEKQGIGIRATRSFVEVTGGPDSLPDFNDAFAPKDFKNCTLRKQSAVIFHHQHSGAGSGDKLKIMCEYSTPNMTAPEVMTDDELEDQRRYTSGAEIISIPNAKDTWQWSTAPDDDVDVPISIIVGVNTFTITKVYHSAGAKDGFIAKVEANQGTINGAEFQGHAKGSVLFLGVDGGTEDDENGDTKWVFTLQFAFRNITDADAVISEDTWQYVWRPDASGEGGSKWDQPKKKDGSGKLYRVSDFATLLR